MISFKFSLAFGLVASFFFTSKAQVDSVLVLKKTIKGQITPKSIVHNGNGLFFAQNMIYNHSVTVYNRNFQLIKTISDKIKPSNFDSTSSSNELKGSPVEVAFSHNGTYAWVSNYRMFGKGFNLATYDTCKSSDTCAYSYIYKINTATLVVENILKTGCVPKFLATTNDNRYLLVSNWCSGNVSIFDMEQGKLIKNIDVGSHPRGIAISSSNKYAYVAVMGSSYAIQIDLESFTIKEKIKIGSTPRHIIIDPADKFLYVTLNGLNSIVKYDLESKTIVSNISTGKAPRSMAMSMDGKYLFVVNYSSNTVSKVKTADFSIVSTLKTNHHPIGITYDDFTKQVWVACYSGSIMVFVNEKMSSVKPVQLAKAEPKKFYIVAGSFENENNAELFVEVLRSQGFEPILNANDDTKIRVCYEALDDLETARNHLSKYKTSNPSVWILKE